MCPRDLTREFDAIATRLYARSHAPRWNVSRAEFESALGRALERRFANSNETKNDSVVAAFLESLHVEDLALAIGCRSGNDSAWREFDTKFRPAIEKIARQIARDVDRAREVADSLYGDLFGDARSDGTRRSPLDQYHGRSLLVAWLRAVIAQREAEAWRAEYRAHLDGKLDAEIVFADAAPSEPEDPDRGRYLAMVACELHKTIDALAPRDRLRLSYYYVQELTLAETGALLGEHESTVSRGLSRTRAEIRRTVEGALRKDYRLSDDQIGRCFEYALGDWPFDLARALEPAK
jgi:RNA polymerase sigma factor (sigma-70 family)